MSAERDLSVLLDGREAWNSLAGQEGNPFKSERVQCKTWDEFAREHGLIGRVRMMKIDVEGWEKRVLLGARECLIRNDAPILQVEFSDITFKRAGSSTEEVFKLLESYGYSLYVYDADRKQLLREQLRPEYEYANLIAIKENELGGMAGLTICDRGMNTI
jgi:hypothetical protein